LAYIPTSDRVKPIAKTNTAMQRNHVFRVTIGEAVLELKDVAATKSKLYLSISLSPHKPVKTKPKTKSTKLQIVT
jgi:hypothetical protein